MTDKAQEIYCSGANCPMQAGYNAKNCTLVDCQYRTPTTKQIQEISEIAKPIQKFLHDYYPTPSAVVISHDFINVVESQMGIPLSYEE